MSMASDLRKARKRDLKQLQADLEAGKGKMRTEDLGAWYYQLKVNVDIMLLEDREAGRSPRFTQSAVQQINQAWRYIDSQPTRPVEEGEWTQARQFLTHVSQGAIPAQQYGPSKETDLQVIADTLKQGASDYANYLEQNAREGYEMGEGLRKRSWEWLPDAPTPPGGWGLWAGGAAVMGLGFVLWRVAR